MASNYKNDKNEKAKILHYSYKNQLPIEQHFHLTQGDGLKHL